MHEVDTNVGIKIQMKYKYFYNCVGLYNNQLLFDSLFQKLFFIVKQK